MPNKYAALYPAPKGTKAWYSSYLADYDGTGDLPVLEEADVLFFALDAKGEVRALVLDDDHRDGPLMEATELPAFQGLSEAGRPAEVATENFATEIAERQPPKKPGRPK